MKAHKLDLKDYQVKRKKMVNGNVEDVKEDYGIKEVIANIICHPEQKHKGFRFLTCAKVAEKIADCKKDHIVLDAAEFAIVKESFDNFSSFGRNDTETVRRVYEVEEVEMKEKKEKKAT